MFQVSHSFLCGVWALYGNRFLAYALGVVGVKAAAQAAQAGKHLGKHRPAEHGLYAVVFLRQKHGRIAQGGQLGAVCHHGAPDARLFLQPLKQRLAAAEEEWFLLTEELEEEMARQAEQL